MRTTLIDETLITSPHQGDTYEFFDTLSIPLSAQNEVLWFVNEESFKRGSSLRFKPQTPGTYTIRAHDEKSKQQETVTISVTLPQ
jgi:membrane carboxypeptidase/penicillin-binding protein PbpC